MPRIFFDSSEVPTLNYWVKASGSCFVFEALLESIGKLQFAHPEIPTIKLLSCALLDAWMSVEEAVSNYSVFLHPTNEWRLTEG